jgi:class 3 adenylate cyclase
MFTDIEGSTALTQEVGDEAAMLVLRQHDAIIRAALDAHRGNEVKHTGDGIMAAFDSVTSALSCAIAIQRAVAGHNAGQEDPQRRFEIRMGLAAGEPVAESGDLFGATVQLAARLASSAGAGEVCVADTVRELALGKRFPFGSPTAVTLKGFDQPVRAVTLNWHDDPALV